MTLGLDEISWSAIAAGWDDDWLDVAALRELAVNRIEGAEGEALVPLSELASLPDSAERVDVHPWLGRLATAEHWPDFLALREWQVLRLQSVLDELHTYDDPDEDSLNEYYRMRALEDVWVEVGSPYDVPPVYTEFRSYAGPDGLSGLDWSVNMIHTWIEQQTHCIQAARTLQSHGLQAELQVFARTMERFQAAAEEHVFFWQKRAETYSTVVPSMNKSPDDNPGLWGRFMKAWTRLKRRADQTS